MRIKDSTLDCFKKPFWTNCYFRVQDIGSRTCWGQIIDGKLGRVRSLVSVFPLTDDDWIEHDRYLYDDYDEAHELIKRLNIKNG